MVMAEKIIFSILLGMSSSVVAETLMPDVAFEKQAMNMLDQEVFDKVKDKVVLIRSEGHGSGSGFVAKSDGKTWLYTNEHVARMGAPLICQTLDGRKLDLGNKTIVQVSSNTDLFRFEVSDSTPSLEWDAGIPRIQDAVWVYGNSDGGGVITELKGKVLGVAIDKIEVDAGFVQGNSGGPIVNKEGKVIGVATLATIYSEPSNWIKVGTRFNGVRRYGVRLGGAEWEKVTWRKYSNYSQGLYIIEQYFDWALKVWFDVKDLRLIEKSDIRRFENTTLPSKLKKSLKKIVEQDARYEKASNYAAEVKAKYTNSRNTPDASISYQRNMGNYSPYASKSYVPQKYRKKHAQDNPSSTKVIETDLKAAYEYLMQLEVKDDAIYEINTVLAEIKWPVQRLTKDAEELKTFVSRFIELTRPMRKERREKMKKYKEDLRTLRLIEM